MFFFRSSLTGTFEFNLQLLARDRRAVAQDAQLGPADLRMNAVTQNVVGVGDDVFSPDEFGERDDAISLVTCSTLNMPDTSGKNAS